ncbi:MAG: hypothetical protein R3274_08045 [Desulfobacterales bacterium]|nr:hypothetical protein [Desulfobacterales bacterium]
MPRFSFFTSHSKEPVSQESPLWLQPIPLRLDALLKADDIAVSHADYFQAAEAFLEANSYNLITRAASQRLLRNVKPQDISEIRIHLEKHGAFYHPARVDISVEQMPLSFVLNVAVSEPGRRFIERDYHHMQRLNARTPFDYLPQVYGWEQMSRAGGLKFGLFLGEWFDGYREFHLAIDPSDHTLKIMVWDQIRGNFFLTARQTKTLYAQAAKMLTAYYDLVTFEQVLAWHHAAGDFVVNFENDRPRLKLVTVRRYAAIFENQNQVKTAASNPQRLLQALLVFFLNLSLQMRLDRLEGIGDMVWSDKIAVDATLTGFLEALSLKSDVAVLPDSPLACFMAYLSSCQASDLLDLSVAIVDRLNPRLPELPVIKKNLSEHVATLHRAIQDLLAIF